MLIKKKKSSPGQCGSSWLDGAFPPKPKGRGFIPDQGTCLECGFSPWSRCLGETTDISLPHSLPPFPLSKINKHVLG